MRILLVHTHYLQQGGEDLAFEADARLLEDAGHDVQRYTASNALLLTMSKIKAAAVSIWNERLRSELHSRVEQFGPDVIHFHNTFPLLSPAAYYAAGQRAVVQTLHNYRLICPSALLFRAGESCERCVGHFPWAGITYGCYRDSRAATAAVSTMVQAHRAAGTWERVHAFIALSEHARELFVRGGVPGERLHVKPNFVHPDPGRGAHEGSHYLYVGRLEEQKGVRSLLAAWTQLENPPVLRIIGDGPLHNEVQRTAFNNPFIQYWGSQPHADVLRQMADARGLIFPSLSHENCPLTILEAFATGLPVLASATGNLAAMMGDGGGWTYRAGDPRELADALRRIEPPATRGDLRCGTRSGARPNCKQAEPTNRSARGAQCGRIALRCNSRAGNRSRSSLG